MTFPGTPIELTNWSKSVRSACFVTTVSDVAGISRALNVAREQRLSVIPRGAGHSYTDAALNTASAVIDVTPMRQILSWDAVRGIMCIEPGVTLREMVQMAWQDGWWPGVSPSTPEVTIGGCAAMNVNGRNAWKCGAFGSTILALDVLFPMGETCTLTPERDPQLFYAFVGSMGLLGIITSITIQLQRIPSGYVTVRRRYATSMDEIFNLFDEEEQASDFMEAWLDGFAIGGQLGRGHLTSATFCNTGKNASFPFPKQGLLDRLEIPLMSFAARLARPFFLPGVKMANRLDNQWGRWNPIMRGQPRLLFPFTYWPAAASTGYHRLLPFGVETFQAFVPGQHAQKTFKRLMRYSHEQGYMPIWCIIKQHRRDPFLLSYQVDGFSLELNYPRTLENAEGLKQMVQHMIASVIEAGGRFYLAKDHYLTHAEYRRSIGDEAVDAFLQIKQHYDPDTLLQSDLYRRVFQPPLS
jgi:decaprenylphospho-beta-D-ribofuranose 2-oxidase